MLWLAHLSAGERSAICGAAAAQLHAFRGYDQNVIEVERKQGGSHDAVVGTLHETFWLPSSHIVHIDGLPVTSVARTVFDLAGLPRNPWAFRDPRAREVHLKRITWLVNHAIRDHNLRMVDLMSVLAAVGRRGKPGSAIIRQIVKDLGEDYVPTDSELEDMFLELCDAHGIPRPDGQIRLGTDEELIGRVDFYWRGPLVVAEIDGRQHRAPLDQRIDNRRDDLLGGQGIHVERVTRPQMVYEPEETAARIKLVLERAA
jgi:hypothetical protein